MPGSPFDDTLIGDSTDDILFGGKGKDLIWGDKPGETDPDPDNFGDDILYGGLGQDALVLGTQAQDIQLGGQDTVVFQRGHHGEDAVFNFNLGPIDRYDDINAPHEVDVDPSEPGADLTFDIAAFKGYAGVDDLVDHATISFGNEDEEAIDILGEVSDESFSFTAGSNKNTFDTGDGTVYAGNNGPDTETEDSGDFEIKVDFDQGGSVLFANAASKWFKHFLRSELDEGFDAMDELPPNNSSLNTWFNDNLANGDPTEGLVELTNTEAVGLVGLLNSDLYGNFQFEAGGTTLL